MLLFITTSYNVTADLLFEKFGSSAFRLNFDLWQDYSVVLQPTEWQLSNPVGQKLNSRTATHVFWWKPFEVELQTDELITSEIKYIFRELYNSFARRGLVVGNLPDFHNRLGKLQILQIAAPFFRTPQSLAGWNLPELLGKLASRGIVAKSLSSENTNDGRVLYTKSVEYRRIDRSYPWFLQTEVDAVNDVTVAVCGDDFFAYTRSRQNLKGLDWRRTIGEEEHPEKAWQPRPLSVPEQKALRGLCQGLRVNWGRFDFLEDERGLIFLEFNANGQWAFLDLFDNNGLMRAVISYLLKPPNHAPVAAIPSVMMAT